MPSSKTKKLRKAYEFKLGKKLVSKLSDEQISLLSKFYNSLSESEQRNIDNKIFKGYADTELHEMAEGFFQEQEDTVIEPKVTQIKSSAITASKLFGEDRYQKYIDELTVEGTIEGKQLTPAERKEGFAKKGNKIDFEKFIDKVLQKKVSVGVSAKAQPAIGGGGALVRSPKMNIEKFISPPVTEKTQENLDEILKGIDSILETLKAEQETRKESSDFDRKKEERERRKLQESRLEKRFSGLRKAAEKIIAPVKGILDKILEFFVNILLGRIVYKLIEWMADPENKGKIDSILRFIKDWWPALLSAYILFGTSFGRFTRSILSTVGKFIFKIGKKAIPQLMQFAVKNPVTAALVAGGALAAGGAYVASQQNERRREEAAKKDPTIVTPKQTAETGKTPPPSQLQQEYVQQRGLPMFSGGGLNKAKNFFGDNESAGYVSGEKGVDKVPSMLSDGEFVMSTGAVKKYGVQTLEAMNAAGGGTNKPKVMGGTTYAAGGGMIGSKGKEQSGNIDGKKPLSGNYKIAFDRIQANFPQAKPFHIAAAIGNFETEAPGLKPNTKQYGGGPGRGIAQWETPGRWDTAKKKYGKNVLGSLSDQLNFMKWELETGHPDDKGRPNLPYGFATKNEWLKAKDVNQATLNFMNAYESPGVPHTERRLKNAQNILSSYKKNSLNEKEKQLKSNQPNIIEKGISGVKKFFGFNQGGMVKESTGIDIPGGAADRQMIPNIAVQPGEVKYIIPKDSVDRGAMPLINMIVAATDSNSKAYKDGFRTKIPGPPVKSSPKVTVISAGANGGNGTQPISVPSGAPSFSASSASRSKVNTLGIINF